MDSDPHIKGMLETLQNDPLKKEFAWQALERYAQRCRDLLKSGATADGKAVLHHRAREKLRAELCDLIQPFMGKEHTSYLDAEPVTDGASETKPGE